MASLAENVMSGAQGAQDQAGHTVGTAIEAYQTAQKLEQSKQELAMKQQEQEMNKATWLAQQVTAIHSQSGPARQRLVDGLQKQLPTVYPQANMQIPDLLKKDPEFTQQMAGALNRVYSGKATAEEAALVGNGIAMQTPQLLDAMKTGAEMRAKVEAAQIGGQAIKAQNQQDAQVTQIASKFDQHPALTKLVDLGNKLDNDTTLLSSNDPKHPVTYQAVHEVIQNIATVLGNGTVSDSRTNAITPQLKGEIAAKIATMASDNPNRPADPELVRFAKNMTDRLNGNITHQVAAKADQIASARENAAFFHNPTLAQVAKQKADYYRTGQWRAANQMGNGTAAPEQSANAPAGAPGGVMTFEQFMQQRKSQ